MVISGPRVVSGVVRVDGSGPRQTGFATYFNFEWILQFCLYLGYPLPSFVHFWWILDRLDPSPISEMRFSSLLRFESDGRSAFGTPVGPNTVLVF